MIKLVYKGNVVFEAEKLEDVKIVFEGKLQEFTDFKLDKESDIKINLELETKNLLYEYWWGYE